MTNAKDVFGREGHNASLQHGVDPNPDPALDYAHEHRHEHINHGGAAATHKDRLGQHDEVVYSAGTTDKSHDMMDSPSQDYTTHKMRDTSAEKSVDEESGRVGAVDETEESTGRKWTWKRFYRQFRLPVHIFIWLFFTEWWIVGLIYHRNDGLGWLIPFLLYLCVSLRILTLWVPASLFMKPIRFVWNNTSVRLYNIIPSKLHQPLAAAGTVAVFLVGSFVPEETGENTRANRAVSLAGLVVMVIVMYATSRKRSKIPWHTVIGGMLSQFVIAIFVLRTKTGYDIFNFISFLARTLLGFAGQGLAFLTNEEVPKLTWFLITVIPAIIFFVSLVSLLFHTGLLQWFIGKFAVFFFWSLRVSGAEAVVAAATPFIGQGESAMLIRPFVPHLTLAELHQVMTCGFATIAGSVLIAYINMGLNPQVLVSSCIMSIPASLAISKMRYPETEETLTSGRAVVPEDDEEHKAANALHAFANGAWLGLKIAGMITSVLLCIIAFVGLINALLTWWGKYWNIANPDLTLQLILGYLLFPVTKLLGVENKDLRTVGEIIGVKIITNEFVAFDTLTKTTTLSERSRVIATYACCGFGNIGSLGNQIGVLSQIAPGRSGDVSRVAVSALISGIIATLTSASIAGMLYTQQVANST